MLEPDGLSPRASVHFLVNMLEAYYFADAAAINAVLGTEMADFEGDVETIRHPKNELKRLHPGFDEIEHGGAIIESLDVPHVLSNPETCRSLRTLFGWCSRAIGREFTDVYQLANGSYFEVTRPQIDALPTADCRLKQDVLGMATSHRRSRTSIRIGRRLQAQGGDGGRVHAAGRRIGLVALGS